MALEAVTTGRGEPSAWDDFEDALMVYLGSMVDPDEEDHLVLELPEPEPDDRSGGAPYVQFAAFGDGEMIRAEVSGDAYVHPGRRLSAAARRFLADAGWAGNDDQEKNWFVERPIDDVQEIEVDDDGDFVLRNLPDLTWVKVHEDQPAIEIMAPVVHGVRSRRSAAVEISLLNRDNVWVRWELRGRSIWQTVVLPGLPFAPLHLDAMLAYFATARAETQDDLAFRLRARVG